MCQHSTPAEHGPRCKRGASGEEMWQGEASRGTRLPVLAEAAAAALFARAALPLVLADAFAAAVLAGVAPPPPCSQMFQKLRVMVDLDVEASKKPQPASFGKSSVLMRRDADRLKL